MNTSATPRPDQRPAASPYPEGRLSALISAGEVVDLEGGSLAATALSQLIISLQAAGCVTPFGVRLRNGEIIGRLDLEGVDFPFPLAFMRITMDATGQNGSIVARDARIKRLNISDCTFAGGIIADRARFENGIMIAGGRVAGPLAVRGAEIGGALSVEGAHLGDGKIALLAAGARLSGPLVLRRARCHGEVRLQRTHLASGLRADALEISDEGARLYCDAARIGGDVILSNARILGPVRFENAIVSGGFMAQNLVVTAPTDGLQASGLEIAQSLDLTGANLVGTLTLEGAAIGKRLQADGIEIDGGETAIAANIIHVGGNWDMSRARLMGQLVCPGAQIGGQLRCSGTRIYGGDIAIRADGSTIAGGAYFSRTVITGTVRFPAARINNQFRFSAATIKVSSGSALFAPGAHFARDVELNNGFQTIGGVILDQTHIQGTCDLKDSHIKSVTTALAATSPIGPAVDRVVGRGSGSLAGHRRLTESIQTPPDDLAISLVDARISRVEMPSRTSERPRGIVDLSRAEVGAYVDWAATWPPPAMPQKRGVADEPPDHLVLDGFTYQHLENPAGILVALDAPGSLRERASQRRIAWLLGQSADNTGSPFKPQAWVYLSRQLTNQGLDRDAREITIERRRRERRSRWSTPSARWESRFLDWFALYGFNPWRTVMWMAAVIILFAGVWSWGASQCGRPGCFDETVFVTSKRDAFSPDQFTSRYPPFHPLAYSFDVFVPFVSFGYEEHWRPNIAYGPIATWRLPNLPAFAGGETTKDRIFAEVTITTGGLLYVLVIIEKVLGLILTSLMVTGFTGLLRGHD